MSRINLFIASVPVEEEFPYKEEGHVHIIVIKGVPGKCSRCGHFYPRLRPYAPKGQLICMPCFERDPHGLNRLEKIIQGHDFFVQT